jgi:coenzyme F420-reducing hydrogenase beta subunit
VTAGYSGKPLPAKLGVRPDSRVLVSGAPAGFTLDCPHHVRAGREPYDIVVLFCPTVAALERGYAAAYQRLTMAGALWVAWPKRSSGVATDLTENGVRAYALSHGLVDVKVAAVDETWSGLKLVRRLADRTVSDSGTRSRRA